MTWPIGARALLGMAGFAPTPEQVRSRVSGELVVITGASRGIGERLALRLAGCGAKVVLIARGAEDLRHLADRIAARGGWAVTYPLDLRDTDAARSAGERIVASHGPPAIIVSNAGHSIFRLLEDYTDRFHDVQRLFGVNALGPIAFLLPMLASMRARGGHLISVSAVSVDVPSPGWSSYGASKSAFEAWLRGIAPEIAADGIATTSVHLPLVRTAMSEPTAAYRNAPALSADEAAGILCRAIATRPRLISPWWARLGGVLSTAAPGLHDRLAAPAVRSMRRHSR